MADKLPAKTEGLLQQKVRELTRQGQRVNHTKFTRAPLAQEVPDGGIVFARISGATFLYTKFGEQLSRVAFTDG